MGHGGNDPLLVDDHRAWDALDSINLANGFFRASDPDPGLDRRSFREGSDQRLVFIGDGDEANRLTFHSLDYAVPMRHGGDAGSTPGRPKLKHHHMSFHGFPVDVKT